MNHLDEAPKLNPWPFIFGDIVLIGAAAFISSRSASPLEGAPLLAIAGCVTCGAVLSCLPFILSYTRQQDLALAERQNEIAALARTTAASAEQLGIAASGLNTLAETVARALKHADQLPAKLQDKINAFKTQLNEIAVTENEALAQEVNTLRSSEMERFESAFAAMRKTASELAQLDGSIRSQLAAFDQSLLRFSTAGERAAADISGAIATSRAETERSLQDVLAGLEARLAALAQISPQSSPETSKPYASSPMQSEVESASAIPAVSPAPYAERHVATPASPASRPPASVTSPTRATVTADPLLSPLEGVSVPESSAGLPRKRLSRKPSLVDDAQPSLSLELADSADNAEYSQLSPDDNERSSAISADGLTRLLVTAYIGIGNKLHVRGDGPGLSWETGVPLQFVSIGKWRWETAEASQPLTLKLYKNDEIECAAVGAFTLEPGHQQEVRASF